MPKYVQFYEEIKNQILIWNFGVKLEILTEVRDNHVTVFEVKYAFSADKLAISPKMLKKLILK